MWTSETKVEQRTTKSSHIKKTNCGLAVNEVQQRTKKSSDFRMSNCGQAES